MRDDAKWILLGLGVLVVMAGGPEWGDLSLWSVPIPDLVIKGVTFPAMVSQEFRGASDASAHLGVDLMYQRRSPLDWLALAFQGHNGNAKWFEPPTTPVLAARDGVVYSVDTSARGVEIVLDHGPPWATYYQHVTAPLVKKGDRVKAGQQIATAGYDPTDPEGLRHLHFACWYKGAGNAASVDPGSVITRWRRAVWTYPESNV